MCVLGVSGKYPFNPSPSGGSSPGSRARCTVRRRPWVLPDAFTGMLKVVRNQRSMTSSVRTTFGAEASVVKEDVKSAQSGSREAQDLTACAGSRRE
mmetsp:Transcript_57206/g.130631  ORF Transcript_57206/g.130631 Transcript_57206/m.130631 type:complete len:96 (-) Transcript_57206:6-293(-)